MTATARWSGAEDLPVLVIDNGTLRLTFVPTHGGRLLSLRADGAEVLWQNPELVRDDLTPRLPVSEWPAGDGTMSTWANLGGSKTWPAPQAQNGDDGWDGPPDGVIDSGPWSANVTAVAGTAVAEFVSEPDLRTGLRITRRFSVPARGSGFEQLTTFENTSTMKRRWSIWEVCQVPTASGAGLPASEAAIVVPAGPGARALDLGQWHGAVILERDHAEFRLPIRGAVGKRGFADVSGSVSYQRPDGRDLTIHAAPVPGASYPDGGAQIEVWMQAPVDKPIDALGGLHPVQHLAELEILGPLVELAPGDRTSLVLTWTVDTRTADESAGIRRLRRG